jgi:hypothetical protein
MQRNSVLLSLGLAGILLMGLAGWWLGNLNQGQDAPATPSPPASAPLPASPVIADLKSDWSNTQNPHQTPAGTWSFLQDTLPLAKIDRWSAGNAAGWGPPANTPGDFLPFRLQASSDGGPAHEFGPDFKSGDILIHTTDPTNSAREGAATISFRSALTGTATIKGNLWPTRFLDRTNDWLLLLRPNGPSETLASGTLPEDHTITREQPAAIDIRPFTLRRDDTIQLIISRNPASVFGDFAAAALTITIIPENAAAPASQPAPIPPATTAPAQTNPGIRLSVIFSSLALALSSATLAGVILLLVRQRRHLKP